MGTGQGSILDDEDKHKTKDSTFKPKALRNPKTYKNLQNPSDEKGKENTAKTKTDRESGITKIPHLRSVLENKNYDRPLVKESKEDSISVPKVSLRPVRPVFSQDPPK